MKEKKYELADKLRSYISKYGIENFDEEHLQKEGITQEELDANYSSREDMVKVILEYERKCFEEVFDEYNFDGWNAIDIFLLVGQEINDRFFNVSHLLR